MFIAQKFAVRALHMVILAVILCFAFGLSAQAETIRIAGSSTVYPFATVVAEQVGRKSGSAPIVEATGSGAGMRSLCQGAVDISNASRRIKSSELEQCHANGVRLVEFWVGRDGIVFAASAENQTLQSLSLKDIYLALAREVPAAGEITANPHKLWRDVNPALPAIPILVYGPPPTSGTRDALESLALEAGAKQIPMLKDLRQKDKKAFQKIAHTLRTDGLYVEGGENDNLLIRKLENEPDAVAIFGFSYLDNNRNRLKSLEIDGVAPEFDNILDGAYPVTRPLYFYIRHSQFDKARNYIEEFIDAKAIGEEGYLTDKGLIPLAQAEYRTQAARVKSREILTLQHLRE